MRRIHILFVVMAAALPFAAEAAFTGPEKAPPDGNVPGVVWNMSTGGGQGNEQSGAEFNIDGSGRLGGDLILGDTKALRIDSVGAAEFNIGNWGNGVQPLTIRIYGDVVAEPANASEGSITAPKFCIGGDCIDAWPAGGGGGGVTSLTAGAGLSLDAGTGDVTVSFDDGYGDARYVLKDGDTMNGPLVLDADPADPLGAATKQYADALATQKLDVAGGIMTGALELAADPVNPMEPTTKQYVDAADFALSQSVNNAYLRKDGVQDTALGRIFFGQGLEVTGADATERGIYVNNAALDTGISIVSNVRGVVSTANNYPFLVGGTPDYGFYVAQSTNGGYFRGSSRGIWAKSASQAGYFENELMGVGNYAVLGGTTAPGEFYSAAGTNALYVSANSWLAGNVNIGGTIRSGGNMQTDGKLTALGDVVANSNTLSGCAWTAYLADGAALQCPAATPIMSGMQRGAGTTRIYCCAL